MKEQFDKKLTEKIKDSFAKHQEPFDPKQWDKFSALYFESKVSKKKSTWIWWVSGIAASLLVGVLLFPLLNDTDQLAQEGVAWLKEKEVLDQNDKSPFNDQSTSIEDAEKNAKRELQNRHESKQSIDNPKEEDFSFENRQPEYVLNIAQDQNQIKDTAIDVESDSTIKDMMPILSDWGKVIVAENKAQESNSTPASIKMGNEEKPKAIPLEFEFKNSLLADDQRAQKIIDAWLIEDVPDNIQEVKSKDLDKAMRLGLILVPQTISSNTQAMNLGAGLMSEFSFSKRLKIDVGLAYAQQSINPNINQEIRSTSSVAIPLGDLRTATFSNNFVNATYELSFGQLEIPLNLKYKIIEKKDSDFYLITGISNMVYLNQKNVGTFTTAQFTNNGLISNQQAAQTFTETVRPGSVDSSGDVYVGQMINLSLAYEYSLQNGTFISVEPFYKLSMGGQTFVNQQFAIGGLNLRMNFQIKK